MSDDHFVSDDNLLSKVSSKIVSGAEITPQDLQNMESLLCFGIEAKESNTTIPMLDRSFLKQLNESQPQIVRHVGMVQVSLQIEDHFRLIFLSNILIL